jgi:hypothetical protein
MTSTVSGPLADAARVSLLEGQIVALRDEITNARSEDVRAVLTEFLGRREADLRALTNKSRQ